jgi:hypothetical protein
VIDVGVYLSAGDRCTLGVGAAEVVAEPARRRRCLKAEALTAVPPGGAGD